MPYFENTVEILSKGENTLEVYLRWNTAFVNGIRRVLMSDIPSYTIDPSSCVVIENDGVLPTGVLTHRLQTIPLNIDYRAYHPTDTFAFRLYAEAGTDPMTVYSGALVCVSNPNLRPLHDDIPLLKLNPHQRVNIQCTATRGVGNDNALFSHVCVSAIRPLVKTIRLRKPIQGEDALYIKNNCPGRVFDIEDGRLVAKRPFQCTLCRDCYRDPQAKNYRIEITPPDEDEADTEYVLSIESIGILPPDVLFREACAILANKCKVVKSETVRLERRMEVETAE